MKYIIVPYKYGDAFNDPRFLCPQCQHHFQTSVKEGVQNQRSFHCVFTCNVLTCNNGTVVEPEPIADTDATTIITECERFERKFDLSQGEKT